MRLGTKAGEPTAGMLAEVARVGTLVALYIPTNSMRLKANYQNGTCPNPAYWERGSYVGEVAQVAAYCPIAYSSALQDTSEIFGLLSGAPGTPASPPNQIR